MIFPYNPVGPMLAPCPMGHELRLGAGKWRGKLRGCGSTNTKAKKVAVQTQITSDYSDMTQHFHETMTPKLVADDQMVSIGYVFGSSYRRRSFNQLCPLGAVQKVGRSPLWFPSMHIMLS